MDTTTGVEQPVKPGDLVPVNIYEHCVVLGERKGRAPPLLDSIVESECNCSGILIGSITKLLPVVAKFFGEGESAYWPVWSVGWLGLLSGFRTRHKDNGDDDELG